MERGHLQATRRRTVSRYARNGQKHLDLPRPCKPPIQPSATPRRQWSLLSPLRMSSTSLQTHQTAVSSIKRPPSPQIWVFEADASQRYRSLRSRLPPLRTTDSFKPLAVQGVPLAYHNSSQSYAEKPTTHLKSSPFFFLQSSRKIRPEARADHRK